MATRTNWRIDFFVRVIHWELSFLRLSQSNMVKHHMQEVFEKNDESELDPCYISPMTVAAILLSAALFPSPSRLLLNQDHRHDAFAAVGRLRIASACTAFLVQPGASADGPVYALTNGHCVLGAAGNEVVTNLRVPAGSSFTFHYFIDAQARRESVAVRAIPYATLKGLDIA